MENKKHVVGAAIPTDEMISFLTTYADSGLTLERWQMVLGIANRLRYLDEECNRMKKQYAALVEDAKSAGPDICNICKYNGTHIEECESDCKVCDLTCACKNCRQNCNFEWRGEA